MHLEKATVKEKKNLGLKIERLSRQRSSKRNQLQIQALGNRITNFRLEANRERLRNMENPLETQVENIKKKCPMLPKVLVRAAIKYGIPCATFVVGIIATELYEHFFNEE